MLSPKTHRSLARSRTVRLNHADELSDSGRDRVEPSDTEQGLITSPRQEADSEQGINNNSDQSVVQRVYKDDELNAHFSNALPGQKIDRKNGVITAVAYAAKKGGGNTKITAEF